jgi:hypothetical protein
MPYTSIDCRVAYQGSILCARDTCSDTCQLVSFTEDGETTAYPGQSSGNRKGSILPQPLSLGWVALRLKFGHNSRQLSAQRRQSADLSRKFTEAGRGTRVVQDARKLDEISFFEASMRGRMAFSKTPLLRSLMICSQVAFFPFLSADLAHLCECRISIDLSGPLVTVPCIFGYTACQLGSMAHHSYLLFQSSHHRPFAPPPPQWAPFCSHFLDDESMSCSTAWNTQPIPNWPQDTTG